MSYDVSAIHVDEPGLIRVAIEYWAKSEILVAPAIVSPPARSTVAAPLESSLVPIFMTLTTRSTSALGNVIAGFPFANIISTPSVDPMVASDDVGDIEGLNKSCLRMATVVLPITRGISPVDKAVETSVSWDIF